MPGVPTSAGLAVEEYERAAWAVTPEGRRYRGAGAVNLAVAVALGTNLPYAFYRLPLVKRAQDRAYDWIAANRHRLPGTSRTARSTRASALERPVLRSGGPSSDSPRSALAALLEHEEGGKRRTLTRTGCGHAQKRSIPCARWSSQDFRAPSSLPRSWSGSALLDKDGLLCRDDLPP